MKKFIVISVIGIMSVISGTAAYSSPVIATELPEVISHELIVDETQSSQNEKQSSDIDIFYHYNEVPVSSLYGATHSGQDNNDSNSNDDKSNDKDNKGGSRLRQFFRKLFKRNLSL
ncbi:MAG: hypothetical protein ATN31_00605 [Candidatus Epulonipiscioides saccharophilum]|nr:MAG: hypothetical protein ATN31_00605 [Epulopiscium sp. AS2M-Bin001]